MYTSIVSIFAFIAPLIAAAPLANTVRVQLNGLNELAIQREVTINTLTNLSGSFTDGFIQNLNGHSGVKCQAFTDSAGTKKAGGKFGSGGAQFNNGKAVKIVTIKCA